MGGGNWKTNVSKIETERLKIKLERFEFAIAHILLEVAHFSCSWDEDGCPLMKAKKFYPGSIKERPKGANIYFWADLAKQGSRDSI